MLREQLDQLRAAGNAAAMDLFVAFTNAVYKEGYNDGAADCDTTEGEDEE